MTTLPEPIVQALGAFEHGLDVAAEARNQARQCADEDAAPGSAAVTLALVGLGVQLDALGHLVAALVREDTP